MNQGRIGSHVRMGEFVVIVAMLATSALTGSCFLHAATDTDVCQAMGMSCGEDQFCDSQQGTCKPVDKCGNGKLDEGEACDDGNRIDDDGCNSNCTLPGCGDGLVTKGEVCDDWNKDDCGTCNARCDSFMQLEPARGVIVLRSIGTVADFRGESIQMSDDKSHPLVKFVYVKPEMSPPSGTTGIVLDSINDSAIQDVNFLTERTAHSIGGGLDINAENIGNMIKLTNKYPGEFGNITITTSVDQNAMDRAITVSGMGGGRGGRGCPKG